jgi:hypothetical protein
MSTQLRDVVEHSVEALIAEVVALTLDGWAVSKTCPGDVVGYQTFTVSMFRDSDTVDNFRQKSLGIAEKPKLTRAEILANARAAKAKNKAPAKLDIGTIQ